MRLSLIKPDQIFAAGFQIVFLWSYVVSSTAATCSGEQKHSCKKAVEDGSLDRLPAGGYCREKSYVQFTHVCIVDNYQPSTVGHCCCQHEEKIMCCRYHQSFSSFRCTEGDDTIGTVSDLPLHILLPSIIGPLALILCCAFCCVKCCCYRYDDDSEICCCRCCSGEEASGKKSREKGAVKPRMPAHDEARTPLTTTNVPQSHKAQCCAHCPRSAANEPSDKLFPQVTECSLPSEKTYVVPSAPSAQDVDAYRDTPVNDSYRQGLTGGVGVGFGGAFTPTSYPPHPGVTLAGERNDAYARSQSSDTSSSSSVSHYSALVNRSQSFGATNSTAVVSVAPPYEAAAAMPTVCVHCHGVPGEAYKPPSYDQSQHHQAGFTQVPQQDDCSTRHDA